MRDRHNEELREDYLRLRNFEKEMNDNLDRFCVKYRMSRKEIELAKLKVQEAVNIVTFTGDTKIKKFSHHEQGRIINALYDMQNKGKPCVTFVPMEDGKGIYNLQNGTKYYYE